MVNSLHLLFILLDRFRLLRLFLRFYEQFNLFEHSLYLLLRIRGSLKLTVLDQRQTELLPEVQEVLYREVCILVRALGGSEKRALKSEAVDQCVFLP